MVLYSSSSPRSSCPNRSCFPTSCFPTSFLPTSFTPLPGACVRLRRHQGAKRHRLPGLPVVLLSSISAAFLTWSVSPARPSRRLCLVWLPQTALARSVPVLRRPVRRGKPRSHAGLSSDFVHAATNRDLP